MAKNEAAYTKQMEQAEELAKILAKSKSERNGHEIIVTLGSAFISGLEAGLQLSGQKGVESGANH